MKKQCNTCIFWETDDFLFEDIEYGKDNRLCMAAIHVKDLTQDEAMIVCDASKYFGELYTSADHFCKRYKRYNMKGQNHG